MTAVTPSGRYHKKQYAAVVGTGESVDVLPTHEIDTLTLTVTEAIDLAAEGKPEDGYTALLAGLQQAEEVAADGVEWGKELVSRWRTACENYAKHYGVKIQ